MSSESRTNLSVSVVLLAHNEAEIIEKVIRDFDQKVTSKVAQSELLVAEDGSTDGTKEILGRLLGEYPKLRWEEGKEKLGYVGAFVRAVELAKYDWVVFCDLSGKHDPEDFWKMFPMVQDDGYEMVIGYKAERKDPIYRLLMSKIFNQTVNSLFGVEYRDINCPFRIFRRSTFLDLAKKRGLSTNLVNAEFALRFQFSGKKVGQIPIKHFARANGPSRGLPIQDVPKASWQAIKGFVSLRSELLKSESKSYGTREVTDSR